MAGVRESEAGGVAPVVALATFIALFYVGVVMNGMIEARENAGASVAALKQKLPPRVHLVSFGLVETLFTYYYGEPVAVQKWPTAAKDLDPRTEYFCFTWDREFLPPLPFAWHVEGEIPCDRLHSDHPVKRVIVGKRSTNVAMSMPLR